MEHPASGLKNITHGEGLAAFTPVVIEKSYKGEYFKFAKIARLLGGGVASDLPRIIRAMLKALDLERHLGAMGFTEKDIPWLAENCMKVSAAGVANNPVVFTQSEIAEIYMEAM